MDEPVGVELQPIDADTQQPVAANLNLPFTPVSGGDALRVAPVRAGESLKLSAAGYLPSSVVYRGEDVLRVPMQPRLDGHVVDAATGLPVVLAGGSRITDEELLTRQEAAMRAGAVGCSVGRNIFMHERPEAITRALYRVIVDRWPAAQALEELTGAPV